jgi:hypothetical protein
MHRERTINIEMVNQSVGIGIEPSKTYKAIHYSGNNIKEKMD